MEFCPAIIMKDLWKMEMEVERLHDLNLMLQHEGYMCNYT